jgi:Domain of unknown function (DUF4440)
LIVTRLSRLPGTFIIVSIVLGVNPFVMQSDPTGHERRQFPHSRYNLAMHPRLALASLLFIVSMMWVSACTFYGDHPARAFSEATGGEGLERVFWKQVQAANWKEVERALASNYIGTAPSGSLDRETTLAQYRESHLKDYSLGDLRTELNGSTIVVTYSIALNGTAGSQPLPSTPQHMMTVWQQQKAGWVVIAHSVSQP